VIPRHPLPTLLGLSTEPYSFQKWVQIPKLYFYGVFFSRYPASKRNLHQFLSSDFLYQLKTGLTSFSPTCWIQFGRPKSPTGFFCNRCSSPNQKSNWRYFALMVTWSSSFKILLTLSKYPWYLTHYLLWVSQYCEKASKHSLYIEYAYMDSPKISSWTVPRMLI